MKCSDCNHFVTDIYAGCTYCKAMRVINKLTRQELISNAIDLYGFEADEFEEYDPYSGPLTKAEIIDYLGAAKIERIAAYELNEAI